MTALNTTAMPAIPDDEPIPFTLTPKAEAALREPVVIVVDECQAVFRTLAVDEAEALVADVIARGRTAARAVDERQDPGEPRAVDLDSSADEPVCDHCGRGADDCECWKLDTTRPATTREIPAYEWEW